MRCGLLFGLVCALAAPSFADTTYHDLSSGSLTQNWNNTALIAADDNWSGVASIVGYRGDDLTTTTGTDPKAITTASAVIDVVANRTTPNSDTQGGVIEYQLVNPVVALAGSATADAPHLVLYLNAAGRQDVTVAFTLRDLETGPDNAVQQIAVQYRTSGSAAWSNVPGGYVADATAGPSLAGADIPVSVVLPAAANGAAQIEVRIMTTNAGGSDEYVGIDDIVVSSAACPAGGCTAEPPPPPPVITSIHDIQGAGSASPLAGSAVVTEGVVTARKRNGYFIQEPIPDADAATSEGIFVFTSSAPAADIEVGDTVRVSGTVAEFTPANDAGYASSTQIVNSTYLVINNGTPASVPAPVALTAFDLDPARPFDYFERFEGMYITVPPTIVVAPSDERGTVTSGEFFVTLPGVPKPYRQPGIEADATLASSAQGAAVPRFDTNPEVLRVDTEELFALNGTRTAGITAVVGANLAAFNAVLDYEERTYSALPVVATPQELPALTNNTIAAVQPLAAPPTWQFRIAGANLENFDSAASNFADKRAKAILAICDVLRAPDIIGTVEVRNLATLEELAGGLDEYAGCGGADYTAYLVTNPSGTQHNGFLVKESIGGQTRITVDSAFLSTTPEGGLSADVNDRRPFLLNARVHNPNGGSLPVTVIANHLKALIGVADPIDPNTRDKQRNQAQYLASLAQRLQAENPNLNLALLGDFNSFQFNGGWVDVLGTVVGNPIAEDAQTYTSGDNVDLVNPNLVNLVTTLPAAEQYSYNFLGDRQTLDHIVVNQNLYARFLRLEIPHVNSEYPSFDPATGQSLVTTETRPEGYADHDPLVATFRLPTNTEGAVRVVRSGLTWSRTTRVAAGSITLTNLTGAPIAGPFTYVFGGLDAAFTVINKTGDTVDGEPYIRIDATLAPGASITFPVRYGTPATFRTPAHTPLVYISEASAI